MTLSDCGYDASSIGAYEAVMLLLQLMMELLLLLGLELLTQVIMIVVVLPVQLLLRMFSILPGILWKCYYN